MEVCFIIETVDLLLTEMTYKIIHLITINSSTNNIHLKFLKINFYVTRDVKLIYRVLIFYYYNAGNAFFILADEK